MTARHQHQLHCSSSDSFLYGHIQCNPPTPFLLQRGNFSFWQEGKPCCCCFLCLFWSCPDVMLQEDLWPWPLTTQQQPPAASGLARPYGRRSSVEIPQRTNKIRCNSTEAINVLFVLVALKSSLLATISSNKTILITPLMLMLLLASAGSLDHSDTTMIKSVNILFTIPNQVFGPYFSQEKKS